MARTRLYRQAASSGRRIAACRKPSRFILARKGFASVGTTCRSKPLYKKTLSRLHTSKSKGAREHHAGTSKPAGPESSAVRVALWRAMHLQVDPPPHVLEDEIGLKLAGPDHGGATGRTWTPRHAPVPRVHRGPGPLRRGSGRGSRLAAASASTSFSEPAWTRSPSAGRRSPRACGCLRSISQALRPGSSSDYGARLRHSECLRFVPVDFEAGDAWLRRLVAAGFDAGQPAVVASTGVSMYLTKDAIAATLRQVAALAPGSTLAMTFLLPLELRSPRCVPGFQRRRRGREPAGRLSSASSRRRRC